MNPFDSIRTERPMVDPVTSRRRNEVRDLLLGPEADATDGVASLVAVDSAPPDDSGRAEWAASDSEPPRRRWLLTAAAAGIMAVGLAGLIASLSEPGAAPVIDLPTPPSTGSIETSEPPTGEPGDAVEPPSTLPLPIEQNGASTLPDPGAQGDASVESDSEQIADEPPAFTPLVLSTPPDGYELFSASFLPGDEGFGIARYRNPGTTTELHILIRDNPDWTQPLVDLGRITFDVDGLTVYAGGEGNGDCLSDVCQIDLQFDERAGVSIMWVTVDGTTLRAGSTRDTLLPLVPSLAADPSVWVAHTGETQFPLPTSTTTPLLVPYGSTEPSYTGTVFGGPPGSSTVTLRAPDGTGVSMYLSPGPATDREEVAGDRRFGDVVFGLLSEPGAADMPVYRATHPCWNMQINDGGRWTGGEWSDPLVELFESFTGDETGVEIDLPVGWDVIAASDRALMYEVQFSVPRPVGEPAQVSVLQSLGQHAYYGAGTPSTLTRFDTYGPGWASDAPQPEMTQIFYEANGWSYVVSSGELASGDLMDLVTSMTAVSVDDWIADFGPLDVADNNLTLDGDCAVSIITVG